MKNLKGLITRLKTKFSESISLDFGEISNENIIDNLDQLYNLISRMESKLSNFDMLYMKEVSKAKIDKINQEIKSETPNLHEILKSLFQLTQIIKNTYFVSIEGAYRSEIELQTLAADIQALEVEKADYDSTLQNAKALLLTVNQIQQYHTNGQQIDTNLKTFLKNSQDASNTITAIEEAATKSQTTIINAKSTIDEKKEDVIAFTDSIDNAKLELGTHTKKLLNLISSFNAQSKQIQEIIDDANRASMAGSFKSRAEDLKWAIMRADIITYVTLLTIAGISYWLFETSTNAENIFDYQFFFIRLPIILPLIWIAWLNSRKSAYLFRLREDYAYKYASAMAFEGYRKQVQERSEELETELLQTAVNNLGSNPIKVFDKEVKHSLLSEIKEILKDFIGKSKS